MKKILVILISSILILFISSCEKCTDCITTSTVKDKNGKIISTSETPGCACTRKEKKYYQYKRWKYTQGEYTVESIIKCK